MRKKLELMGRKFGRLLVVKELEERKNKAVQWECLCDCGNTYTAISSDLNSGNTSSCGCLLDEFRKVGQKTHGMTGTGEYNIWKTMLQRCSNPKNRGYYKYGGRGISVCSEWEHFENFIRDMGQRPSEKHTIERVDVNGNYCKENCIWTDNLSLQCFNQRRRKDNSSGRTGVNWCTQTKKWKVRISKDNAEFVLGHFIDFKEAVRVREEAELKYYGFIKE